MKYSVKYKRVFDKDGNIVDISTVNETNRLSEYYSIAHKGTVPLCVPDLTLDEINEEIRLAREERAARNQTEK